MKLTLESSFLTWNSIPIMMDGSGKNVVFTYAGEGAAKLTFGEDRVERVHLTVVGGEKFDAGPDYLDYEKGNYYDCYAHVNLRDNDGDIIVLNSTRINNQEFILAVAGGTGKWDGISGELSAHLIFVETRETPGMNPATHFWCVYAFDGVGDVTLPAGN